MYAFFTEKFPERSNENPGTNLHTRNRPPENRRPYGPLRCVDKPSTSLPSRMTYTEDFIRTSVGF